MLGFQGVPFKSQSWVYPTVNCLVDLVETPFFVITLKDVEVVNLERVSFGIRNFDLAIVFKDFNREPHKITSIDTKYLDSVKARRALVNPQGASSSPPAQLPPVARL